MRYPAVLVCIVSFLAVHLAAGADAASDSTRSDALGVVLVRDAGSKRAGQCFFIGDGSLAVTARHVLYGNSRNGQSESLGMVSLLSPYLGGTCEARLVAEDRELDLAVVQSPWMGHPSLELADEQSLAAATSLEVECRIAIAQALVESKVEGDISVTRIERLPVDYIGMRGGQSRIIALDNAGELSMGRSGSALLLPGTSKVVGCLSTWRGNGPIVGAGLTQATAFSIGQARAVLQRKGLAVPPKGGAMLARAGDAAQVIASIVRVSAASNLGDDPKLIEGLAAARPANAEFQVLMASAFEESAHVPEAEACYRKALELNPRSTLARAFYAQLLTRQKRPNEALRLLQDLHRDDPQSPIWAIGIYSAVGETKPAETLKAVREAAAVSPRNANLFACEGMICRRLGDHAAAAASLGKAVELNPDSVAIRVILAVELDASGSLDEAESQFRIVRDSSPGDPRPHFLLARFLADHKPEKSRDAVAELEKALLLPESSDGPSKAVIEELLKQLRARPTTQSALHL